jgi:hypothetical protein
MAVNVEVAQGVFIPGYYSSGSDRRYSQFWLKRSTDFAYQENIERGVKLLCYFERNRHTAPWKPEYNGVRRSGLS